MSEIDTLAVINGVKPKIYLKDGDTKEAKSKSSSQTTYRLRRTGDHYYCTCPAWRNAGGAVDSRTCKHLKELLGEKYENERLKLMNPAAHGGAVRGGKRKLSPDDVLAESSKRIKNADGGVLDYDALNDDWLDGMALEDLEHSRDQLVIQLYQINRRIAKIKKEQEGEGEDEGDVEMKDGVKEEEGESGEEAAESSTKKKPTRRAKATVTLKGKKKATSDDDEADEEEDDDDDEEVVEVNKVGQKTKPSLLLAEKWDLENGIDPTDWWMSEKLDGVRAFWNGDSFLSRDGNKFYAPEWFTRRMPKDVTLDGEFHAGRGTFQELVSIVKTQAAAGADRWKFKVEYCVFDVPSMGNQPFEERMDYLNKVIRNKLRIKWVKVCDQTQVKSKEHLLEELEKVQDEGGEGLMLREPESLYQGRRSKTLLKVKTFHDADATVIGHEGGKGRNTGVCGAIKCRMLDGGKHEFKVGTGLSDKDRKNPPKVGATIIYRYFELTKSGIPRFPSFVGERFGG